VIWRHNLDWEISQRKILQVEWQGHKKGFKSRTAVRVCLQINRESRHEAMKWFPLSFGNGTRKPKIRASFEFDVPYLSAPRNYQRVGPYPVGNYSLCRLFTHVEPLELSKIKVLAFDIGLYFKGSARERPSASKFRQLMPGLRRLAVIMSQGLNLNTDTGSADLDNRPIDFRGCGYFPSDPDRSRYDPYVQILTDFGTERLAHPEWNSPKVVLFNIRRADKYEELVFQ